MLLARLFIYKYIYICFFTQAVLTVFKMHLSIASWPPLKKSISTQAEGVTVPGDDFDISR